MDSKGIRAAVLWTAMMGVLTQVVACDDAPGSIEVQISIYDLSAARIVTEPREGIEVEFAQQSTDKESEDYSKTALRSDDEGEAVGVVTESQLHTFSAVGLEGLQGNVGYFRAAAEDLDLRDMPLPVTDRIFGEYVFCEDALNMNGTDDEGRGAAWLRVYKLGGDFTQTDDLRVTSLALGNDVREGNNLVSADVTGVRYIDIYDDSTRDEDQIGHVDAELYADDFESEGSDYLVVLNGEEIEIELGVCSEGKSAVAYL